MELPEDPKAATPFPLFPSDMGDCDANIDLTMLTELLITNIPGNAFAAGYTNLELVPFSLPM